MSKNPRSNRGQGKGRRPVPARRLAARILTKVLSGNGTARDQLAYALTETPPPERDRGFVTELVYGVVRRLITIDAVIAGYSKWPLEHLDEEVLLQLRLGVYQMLWLKIPPHAVVHEAVELVPHRGAKGFVNGLLRSLQRELDAAEDGAESAPATRRLPRVGLAPAAFGRDIFPEAEAAWLAVTSGHPQSYVDALLANYGKEAAEAVLHANGLVPVTSLRTNLRLTTRDELKAMLAKEGIETETGDRPEALRARATGELTRLPSFQAGLFSIQDETSMAVAPFLGPEPGERILDRCAAPGGKTLHMAELIGGEGTIIATDASAERLSRLRESIGRLGHDTIEVVPPGHSPELLAGFFDRVLLDVPCSNTGVIRRRVELRHRLDELDREALHETQRGLLRDGLAQLSPGGTLVYSTCSISPDENSELVAEVLASLPGFSLDAEDLSLPTERRDGGYMARIKREG